MHISTIIIPIVIVIVGIWLLRKLLHIGVLLAIGAIAVFGWWFFFIR